MNGKRLESEKKAETENVRRNAGYYCEGAEMLDDYFPKKKDLEKLNEGNNLIEAGEEPIFDRETEKESSDNME